MIFKKSISGISKIVIKSHSRYETYIRNSPDSFMRSFSDDVSNVCSKCGEDLDTPSINHRDCTYYVASEQEVAEYTMFMSSDDYDNIIEIDGVHLQLE